MTRWNTDRPFTVHATDGPLGGWCETHCKTLKGAIKSASRFSPEFTSIKVWCRGEMVHIARG